MDHAFFMQRCLELAEQGRGKVGNGALVGAVLVREGKIVAEGWHHEFGGDHAERDLFKNFDQKIKQEDALYVNLEPCCHTGKTPPCTDIIIERGVRQVVIGMTDPDERMSGKGIEQLRMAGINVLGPVIPERCERLNRGFISVRTKHRPWITLKRAQTKDGRTDSKKEHLMITNSVQNSWSHEWLRSGLDAICLGVSTVIKDDPSLNTRFDQKKRGLQPYRIVLDPHLKTPLISKIVTDLDRHRTILIISHQVYDEKASIIAELEKAGVSVRRIGFQDAHFVWSELWDDLVLPRAGYNGLTSMLVEGGPKTWEVFEKAGFVDEKITLVG